MTRTLPAPLVASIVALATLACGGFGGAHPDPSDYGVPLDISVDELFEKTGQTPSALADRELEAGMLDAAAHWYRRDGDEKRFFAAAIVLREWKVKRSRGQPVHRELCSMVYWLDQQGLCHGNAMEFKQTHDGSGYSDTFQYNDWCILYSDAPVRPFIRPEPPVDGGSGDALAASGKGSGLLFEACSDPDAYAAHLATFAAKAAADAARPKPRPKPRPTPSSSGGRRR